MSQFKKLTPFLQSEILNGLLLNDLSYSEIQQKYGVTPEEIAEHINNKAVQPYNDMYSKEKETQEVIHKKTIFGWIRWALITSAACFFGVVLIQSFLGGFESQIVTDSIAYITQPLAKVMNLGIAISFIVLALYLFFPILATFINERVNTTSLKETFLDASSDAKLSFLKGIVLALCILVGLVFSAKAQSPRECIIQTAYKEVGVVEKGGNNRGKRIDEYRSVSLGKTVRGYADPWCGYFASFVYKTCNIAYKAVFSPRARDWFADRKLYVYQKNFKGSVIRKKPQPGDVVGYKFNAGNIGHIEILVEWNEEKGYFLAIGGNTSNKNSVYRDADQNDGVRLKKRDIGLAYVVANHIDL